MPRNHVDNWVPLLEADLTFHQYHPGGTSSGGPHVPPGLPRTRVGKLATWSVHKEDRKMHCCLWQCFLREGLSRAGTRVRASSAYVGCARVLRTSAGMHPLHTLISSPSGGTVPKESSSSCGSHPDCHRVWSHRNLSGGCRGGWSHALCWPSPLSEGPESRATPRHGVRPLWAMHIPCIHRAPAPVLSCPGWKLPTSLSKERFSGHFQS